MHPGRPQRALILASAPDRRRRTSPLQIFGRALLLTAGWFSALLFFPACQKSPSHRVLKLAHGLPPDHPVHQGMEYMARRCFEISEGKLEIEIYPSEQLGAEQQCVELLQIGSLAITKVSASAMESFSDDYKVLGLPYLFDDQAHSYRVLESDIGRDLLNSTHNVLLHGLCFYDAGSRSFYTVNKPILHPDDLQGQKIRVMKSITAMDMVKALGGSPTPISFGELYTALQSGVVDGAENNPPSLYTSRHYEVCRHYSLDEHTTIPDVLIISMHVWNKLSEQEKAWLQQAADESVPVERSLWEESVAKSLREMEKAGVQIYRPDKKPFAERVEPLLESYRNQERIYQYIERVRAMRVPETTGP
jgi:tripartite ATP-independent transporter DctP family solute receptor